MCTPRWAGGSHNLLKVFQPKIHKPRASAQVLAMTLIRVKDEAALDGVSPNKEIRLKDKIGKTEV